MRPHPQFGTLADHPLQLTNVTLRDFVFGDLLFAVINQFEGHFVASPPQAAHLHEVDREVAAQGQFLATVEEDRILIEEAEPTAVGPPRGILVGDKPHHEVLAGDASGPVAQVETQALLHRDGHRIFVIAQPPVEFLHHLAAQRMVDGDQHLRPLVKPPVGAVLPAAEMGRHGDPVAAVHRFHVFLHVFDRKHRPPLLLVHVGHVDRVDEDFGQRAELNKSNGRLTVKQVDAKLDAVWHDNLIPFQKADIFTITRTLERFYDVKIILSPDMKPDKTYSGVLKRKSDIESVLKSLQNSIPIDYKIVGNNIFISPK